VEELARRMLPFLTNAGLLEPGTAADERLEDIVALEQERLKTLAEAPEALAFFFRDPDPQVCIRLLTKNRFARRHSLDELGRALAGSLSVLQEVDTTGWRAAELGEVLNAQGEWLGWKRAELLMPLRIAVSGRAATPPLFETLECVGRAATLRRLEAVLDALPREGG
jgi:glutamyl-tRNA synthetase